jgi:hypothetical protein
MTTHSHAHTHRLQLPEGGHAIVDAKVGEENKQFYNLALAPEPLPDVQVSQSRLPPNHPLNFPSEASESRPPHTFLPSSYPSHPSHPSHPSYRQALADALDLEAMDHHALSRVPFVLLLLKARPSCPTHTHTHTHTHAAITSHHLITTDSPPPKKKTQAQAKQRWLSLGEPLPPASTQAKKRFAEEGIKAMATDPSDDNFVEALKRPYLAYQPFPLPEHTQALFADPRVAGEGNGGSSGVGKGKGEEDFWVVVRALKGFVENEGRGKLPLSGAIPGASLCVRVCMCVREVALGGWM